MIVLIPISNKQTIDSKVIEGLKTQTIPCEYVACVAEGVKHSQGVQSPERVAGEIRSRKLQVLEAQSISAEFVLSMDRDIVLENHEAVNDMVDCMIENEELGAVALWFKQGRKTTPFLPHIPLKCMLFRSAILAKIDFDKIETGECTCVLVKRQIEQMRYKVRYLDFVNRGKEISY